jgi:anaerobic selenocysteine-containing dehydrogenase
MDVGVDRGILVSSRGSKDHPVTRGFLCPRGTADIQRVYSRKRVGHPHMKSQPGESTPFSRVSWEAALDRVADGIQTAIDTHGRRAVLLYDYPGNTGLLAWHFAKRLWSALGATTTDYALCSRSGHTGIGLHYGSSYGLSLTQMAASKAIVFWGNNARLSAPHIWALARRARRENGTSIVCVDPRQSSTAAAADCWMQPRSGSDVALAYGIARYLIDNQGIDRTFIDRYTSGFAAYANAAAGWTPERVQAATGLAEQEIIRVGELLMTHRPAAFMIGLGLQKSMQGAEAARAVSLLPALLGRHRGYHYSNSQGRDIDWPAITGSRWSDHSGEVVRQVAIGERLAAGDFKFVFVLGSNPAVTLPDQNAVRRGLAREDVMVVVHDTHWSETALQADVVLPAATFLEKRDIAISDHHDHCRLSEQAIDPLGESRHEIEVMQHLAQGLGLTAAWLYEEPWAVLKRALAHTYQDGDLSDVIAGKAVRVGLKSRSVYQTPTAKIEFAATAPPEGISPLPLQQSLSSDEDVFVLLNSATAKYTHSQFTDVYGPIPPVVWIHPDDAARLDIGDGSRVQVFNDLAEVTLHATLTTRVLIGNLWAPRPLTGLNSVPLNALVPGKTQTIGGGPIFNSIRVHVRPIDPSH